MTGNPIMVVLVGGVLDVLRQFIQSIGDYPNRHVLPSRRRFIAHLEAGDADAAVAEMEASLKKLQRTYLSKLE
jgi:GntR family transcriptional repressor for pyruvate dehydrogenase complex